MSDLTCEAASPIEPPIVHCPYCDKPAVLAEDSSSIYGGRNYGPLWICHPCKAWVGCHKNSRRHAPLGRLANAELRKAKSAAHAAFDPIWKARMKEGETKFVARNEAYKWLAQALGIKRRACHIGMFDVDDCRRVVELCHEHRGQAA